MVLLAADACLRADVVLPSLFSTHAVLQSAARVPVWGKADPGEAVTVTLGKAHADTVAGADGKWRVNLDLKSVGAGPFELVVQGRNRVVANDVFVGQVWVCSGQSNMEFQLRTSAGAADEYPKAGNPSLRQFQVAKVASPMPLDEVKGAWVVATPESVPSFSAVAYYFGKNLQHALDMPVGLINSSWGGTPVEAWTRTGAFDPDADLKAGAQTARADAVAFKEYLSRYRDWVQQQNRADRSFDAAAFNAEAKDAVGWVPVTLPGTFAAAGLPDAGAVWIERKITLPSSAVGAGLQVWFGDVNGSVRLYWNGVPFGEGGPETTVQRYAVNPKNVVAAEGVLTARIYNAAGAGGIASGQARFRIDYKGGSLQLAGEWQAKSEYAFPPLAAGAAVAPVKPTPPLFDHNVAGYLFDGMIHPLIPLAIAGVIWYQGEHNWNRGWQYRTAFRLMITDWRRQWGQGDFPFYFCQLPNYGAPPAKPGNSNWAEVRESQAAALALPNTGMAVLIDVGDAGNIHPADKRSVGDRLALVALAKTYGKNVVYSGPVYASQKIEGGQVRIDFSNTESGLATRPASSPVRGFMICGSDQKWQWAEARIENGAVVVRSPAVSAPVAVRYAWADNPDCNLYNGAGLPAAPFRTDTFPVASLTHKY
ncbi:MAG: sialate O-acetylesterase [Opitutaceae bacterium]|jgi:sialate O-acetylesterase